MIGQRIKQLRNQKGLSLSELASRANVAKSYLSTIERGIQSNPSIQVLEDIASVLKVSVETIINPEQKENELLEKEWLNLAREAMNSGVSKDEFREFLEFYKWRNKIKNE